VKHRDDENFDHLFTPERIAHLDRISAAINAGGKTYTIKEVKAHLKKKRKEWLKKQSKLAKPSPSRKNPT
jgi:hypothetical protein